MRAEADVDLTPNVVFILLLRATFIQEKTLGIHHRRPD